MLPTPKIKIELAIAKLRGCSRSSAICIMLLSPTITMVPNKIINIPPITGAGIVCKIAPSLPKNERAIAIKAAQVIIAGLKALVRATAPVTSE